MTDSPEFYVEISGISIGTTKSFEIHQGGCGRPSIFSVTAYFPVNSSPLSDLFDGIHNSPIFLSIYVRSSSDNPWNSIIEGVVTRYSIDPIHRVLHIVGFDISYSAMISSSSSSFVNQSPSEIAYSIAAKYGLDANISATNGFVGPSSGRDYTKMGLSDYSTARDDWCLLSSLARNLDYVFLIDHQVLNFCSMNEVQRSIWQVDVKKEENVLLTKNAPFSTSQTISTRSWNSWECESYGGISGDPGIFQNAPLQPDERGPGFQYSLSYPDLSPEQTDMLSQIRMNQLTRASREIRIRTVLVPLRKVLDIILVSGSGSGFDSSYSINAIRRRYTEKHGLVDEIVAYSPIGGMLPILNKF